jgi:hypothetical protein
MIAIKVNPRDKARWEEQKAKLKMKFPKLKEVDLNFEQNMKEEMLYQLEMKLGIPVNELQTLIEKL